MDTLRFVLLLSLVLVGTLLWEAWQQDYGRAPADGAPAGVDRPEAPEAPDIPALVESDEGGRAPLQRTVEAGGDGRVAVRTDVLDLEIGLQGAGIRRASLPRYPVDLDDPDNPYVLLGDAGSEIYVAQGGLLSREAAPTHDDTFAAERAKYTLAPGADTLHVPFSWNGGGVSVTKTYTLRRGSYLVSVDYEIRNNSGEAWRGRSYAQLQRSDPGRTGRRLIYTYTGAVLSSPDKRYEKIDFDDMREQKLDVDITNGWAAMLQHYFVTALVPADTAKPYHYYTLTMPQDRFAIGAMTPPVVVPAGSAGGISERLYVGPKLQDTLKEIAEGLELTVDYGKLWFIAKPLFWCLEWFHDLTGNWGFAIILVTILVKVLFYHLSAAGYRSMANMRRVQPRIKAIQERYRSDRARLNQAMMQIYKEEKINPFGGCLPIVVQIPVFIALYWVLLESVELRQTPFIFWLQDLSSPDPYWVLPVVMGITMFIQQRLNPAPLDPVQEKVMMVMPFAFTVFFGFFPSGLVLYWVVNNILSIGQQWLITRSLVKSGLKA